MAARLFAPHSSRWLAQLDAGPSMLFAQVLATGLFLAWLAHAIGLAPIIGAFAAGRGSSPWVVGWGMVPRGEVGLIFAVAGRQLGVHGEAIFSIIVIMLILTTLVTPPVLTFLLKQKAR